MNNWINEYHLHLSNTENTKVSNDIIHLKQTEKDKQKEKNKERNIKITEEFTVIGEIVIFLRLGNRRSY